MGVWEAMWVVSQFHFSGEEIKAQEMQGFHQIHMGSSTPSPGCCCSERRLRMSGLLVSFSSWVSSMAATWSACSQKKKTAVSV